MLAKSKERTSVKIGFIGLGAMGAPMAECVVKAGYPVFTTFHKRATSADALASLGAALVATPAEVARQADVVITMLPAAAGLKEVVLGVNGLREGFLPAGLRWGSRSGGCAGQSGCGAGCDTGRGCA